MTGHLIRQIRIRGALPGPLTPLAGQLNDDLTHLQGQRIEGMLAQVLELLRPGLALPAGAPGPAGQPLASVLDPFVLEVHRPVDPDVPKPDLPVLPAYVAREHDAALAAVVRAAAAGTSGIAVLVGGSSTGKTRTCWQGLELLRNLDRTSPDAPSKRLGIDMVAGDGDTRNTQDNVRRGDAERNGLSHAQWRSRCRASRYASMHPRPAEAAWPSPRVANSARPGRLQISAFQRVV